MKTLESKGHLLNMFVALAMGGKEGDDLRVPFDDWDCGIIYKGNNFRPERDVGAIWPEVMRLRISHADAGHGRWLVTMPSSNDSQVPPFPPCDCANPLDGYRLAIVWTAFGAEVPDTIQSRLFGLVTLSPFNEEVAKT